jgi:hypothetical protein
MIKIEEKDVIKATGYFLYIYYSDLVYISKFKEWKEKDNTGDYVIKAEGTFYQFLIDYGMMRTLNGRIKEVLDVTQKWINNKGNEHDVDGFRNELKNIRINCTSILASKILFLNNPHDIFPMDSLAKAAIGYSGDKYSEYSKKVEYFFKNDRPNIETENCFKDIIPYAKVIEKDFKNLTNIEIIRLNRLKDILLWTAGEKK